jgi:hypothetical protein
MGGVIFDLKPFYVTKSTWLISLAGVLLIQLSDQCSFFFEALLALGILSNTE